MSKSYLPNFILNEDIFKQVYDINMQEVDDWKAEMDDLLDQAFIDTATWGLEHWEEFLAVDVDDGRSDSYKREQLKAKIRSMKTLTYDAFKSIIDSYRNGEVRVFENVRNRIPPFDNSSWNLHANASVENSIDELVLNAESSDEQSNIIVTVTGSRDYCFGYNLNDSSGYIRLEYLDENSTVINTVEFNSIYGDVYKFTTPSNAVEIDITLSSNSSGQYIFKELFLYRGEFNNPKFYRWYPYTFTVIFVDSLGVPSNLDKVKDTIENVKPAHLDVLYEFMYLLIEDIHNNMTVDELQNQTLYKFAGGVNS